MVRSITMKTGTCNCLHFKGNKLRSAACNRLAFESLLRSSGLEGVRTFKQCPSNTNLLAVRATIIVQVLSRTHGTDRTTYLNIFYVTLTFHGIQDSLVHTRRADHSGKNWAHPKISTLPIWGFEAFVLTSSTLPKDYNLLELTSQTNRDSRK